MESTRYVVEEAKIFEFKGLKGKILETKELTLQARVSPVAGPVTHYRYGAVGGALSQRLSGSFGRGPENGRES
jgi:hypothetical protein